MNVLDECGKVMTLEELFHSEVRGKESMAWSEGWVEVIIYKSRLSLRIERSFFFFLKILFIYSWETQRDREREKQAPHREPNVGLDPESRGSRPGPKAVLNR